MVRINVSLAEELYMVNQTRAVDKIHLVKKMGHLPPEIMSQVARALKLHYNL